MLVKVRKTVGSNVNVISVPKTMYENVFKENGYVLVEEPVEEQEKEQEEVETEEIDVETIPVSEMTKEQLKEFAKIKGIKIPKKTSFEEAKNFVEEAIKEQNM